MRAPQRCPHHLHLSEGSSFFVRVSAILPSTSEPACISLKPCILNLLEALLFLVTVVLKTRSAGFPSILDRCIQCSPLGMVGGTTTFSRPLES